MRKEKEQKVGVPLIHHVQTMQRLNLGGTFGFVHGPVTFLTSSGTVKKRTAPTASLQRDFGHVAKCTGFTIIRVR